MIHSNRFHSSARVIDCSLRVYRQTLPMSIPENEPISFGIDELDDREDMSTSHTSNFLFSSPRGRSSNVSQTIRQHSRIYPNTISRLLASSPAHHNQYRLSRGIAPSITYATTSNISSSSPCLSPIQYTLDTSPTDVLTSDNVISSEDLRFNQISLPPNDDSSVKVRRMSIICLLFYV
jgi:hypothetical protein